MKRLSRLAVVIVGCLFLGILTDVLCVTEKEWGALVDKIKDVVKAREVELTARQIIPHEQETNFIRRIVDNSQLTDEDLYTIIIIEPRNNIGIQTINALIARPPFDVAREIYYATVLHNVANENTYLMYAHALAAHITNDANRQNATHIGVLLTQIQAGLNRQRISENAYNNIIEIMKEACQHNQPITNSRSRARRMLEWAIDTIIGEDSNLPGPSQPITPQRNTTEVRTDEGEPQTESASLPVDATAEGQAPTPTLAHVVLPVQTPLQENITEGHANETEPPDRTTPSTPQPELTEIVVQQRVPTPLRC